MSSADRSRLIVRLRVLHEQATANESKAKEQVAACDRILAERRRDAEQAKKRLAELEQKQRELETQSARARQEIDEIAERLNSDAQQLERLP